MKIGNKQTKEVVMFKQAPLPFTGQKRMFLKHFKAILNEQIPGDGEGWTIIDTFGGSGLLSHAAKQLKPKARVIYNDFDGYAERLAHIDDINALRSMLYSVVGNATQKTKDCRRVVRQNASKSFKISKVILT